MHSWGLYNGRYGLSTLVLIDKISAEDRPLADRMLAGELDRQKRLKEEMKGNLQLTGLLTEEKLFQNYKQLQFIDTLALYFNRIHRDDRGSQTFANVPLSAKKDTAVVIEPREAGRRIGPRNDASGEGWRKILKEAPTEWEHFRFVRG
jgi:hypothetical protein